MISVCIATYYGGKYIKEQLDSILFQLGKDDEVIISDDSSTDDTLSILESYHDERIVILTNQKFHSPVYNFENALKSAKGDFIFCQIKMIFGNQQKWRLCWILLNLNHWLYPIVVLLISIKK